MNTPVRNTHVHFSIALIFLLALAGTARAHDPKGGERGETFTDPTGQFPMPAEWIRKPITHENWAEHADIALAFDQDIYQTVLPLIQRYAREKGLKIEIKEGTCGIAAGMLSRKTIDMGGFCCPAGSADRLPGLRFHTLGIVSKAFFVHPDNPIENLSTGQLRDIYRGERYRWSEFNRPDGTPGPDRTIQTIGRLHCEARPGHWRQLLDDEKMFSPRMQVVGSIPDMIGRVANTRDAIGWEVLSMVEKYKNMGTVKVLTIDGIRPTDDEALAVLKYPFYRVYNITTWEGKAVENQKAKDLVSYLLQEVEKLDPRRFGFVSASRLRKAGWKFSGNELVGEPAARRAPR